MKRILAVLLVLCLSVSVSGCAFFGDVADLAKNDVAKEKTFDLEGLSIELTTDFLQMDFISEDYDFVIGDGTLSILGLKIEHDDTALKDLTTLQFAEYFRSVMEENKPDEVTEVDSIPTMQYTAKTDGLDQVVVVKFYKSTDGFWMLCFSVTASQFDDVSDDINKYAKTVKCE